MTQRFLTTDIIAAEAIMVLDNNLVMANQVHRAEDEFSKSVNGFKVGDTVNMRRPADFEVREGAVASPQPIKEGKVPIVVDKQRGVDFEISSSDLTLNIKELSKRVIKPAMVQLANKIDTELMALYKDVPNWVGTPGQTVNSFADFSKGPERLDEYAVPMSDRSAVLAPADHWGLLGSQTGLFIQKAAEGAYRQGSLGMIGGHDTYMAQNVPTHTVGAAATASAVADAPAGDGVLSVDYDDVKDTWFMYLSTDGWDASTLKKGDVLELSDVFAVNPVTKATLPFKKQFAVLEDTVTASGDTAIKISPPIITEGPHRNVSNAPTDGTTTIAKIGTGGTGYRQNMVFHKNAFALAMVPMEKPAGAVDVARKTYKGLSVRLIPYYDGVNDISNYRMDVLFGTKTVDERLAVRLSGTN
jgi:coat protein Gp5